MDEMRNNVGNLRQISDRLEAALMELEVRVLMGRRKHSAPDIAAFFSEEKISHLALKSISGRMNLHPRCCLLFSQDINKEESLLEKEQSQFPMLQTLLADKQPHEQLWTTALNFQVMSDEWMNGEGDDHRGWRRRSFLLSFRPSFLRLPPVFLCAFIPLLPHFLASFLPTFLPSSLHPSPSPLTPQVLLPSWTLRRLATSWT